MGIASERTRSSYVALTWFVTPHPHSRVDGFLASQSTHLTYQNRRPFHPRPPVLEHVQCHIGRDAHRLANTDRQPDTIADRLTEGTAQVTACHFIPSALAGTGSVVTFRFFNIFRVRYWGQQNGEQGQASRDPNEVLDHGDFRLYQNGLGLLECRSNLHVGGQAEEVLYIPGGEWTTAQRLHPIRDALTKIRMAANRVNSYHPTQWPRSGQAPVEGKLI